MLEEVIKDLAEATDELRKEIEKLTAALKAQSGAAVPAPAATPAAAKPQADDIPTEDIKPLALRMSRAGHKETMRKKLYRYGVKNVHDLTAEQAQDFLSWLNTLEKK